MYAEDWNDEPVVVQQPLTEWTGNTSVFTNSRNSGSHNDRFRNQRGGRSNDRGNWRGGNNQNRDDRRSGGGGGDNFEAITVPSRFVGKIIGKGGSKINELQSQSGARIQVTKDTEDDNTIVKIFGSKDTIQKAKDLINETLEEVFVPRRSEYRPPESTFAGPESSSYSAPAPSEPAAPAPLVNWFENLADCKAQEDEYWSKFPAIIKNFYQEHPDVTALTDAQVEAIRESNNNIVVNRVFGNEESKPIPKPVSTFEQAFFNYPEILDEITKAGFEKPSPIQCQAWPVLLSGEDLIGIAQTGSGKTLAFLLPAFIHIDGQTTPKEERKGPAVLIVAPTRELALQIDKEIKKYHYRGISSCCVYGGGDRKLQISALRKGVDIVIATPGRMNDLHTSGDLYVENITYVVLDEADRMLDMGFEAQIRRVMYSIRPNRQSIMTSATWPPGVRRLATSYMNDPIQVYVGSLDLAATHSVTQVIQILDEREKQQAFFEFIDNLGPDDKVIVFCGTKAGTDNLAVECAMRGVSCTSIHSNRDQVDREQAIADITDGTAKILIATDVASRGLDIEDVTHVLNYDFPKNIEEYVHRVGRTGRAGKTGESISYLTRKDWANAAELIKILEEAEQYVPEELHGMVERYEAMKEKRSQQPGGGRGGGGGGRFNNRNRW